MGGRGSFSGLLATIDDVLGIKESKGTVDEITTEGFGTLEQTENMIRTRNREHLVVFDEEGKAIKAYKGDAVSVSFPEEEALKWKGLTVTHNHPQGKEGFGGTFSFEDMRNATVYEFGSHRAVGCGQGEKNYILKSTDKSRPMDFNRRIASDIPWLKDKMRDTAFSVKQAYIDNKDAFNDYKHMLHVARQKTVGVLNSYYRETAEQYGYIYRAQK